MAVVSAFDIASRAGVGFSAGIVLTTVMLSFGDVSLFRVCASWVRLAAALEQHGSAAWLPLSLFDMIVVCDLPAGGKVTVWLFYSSNVPFLLWYATCSFVPPRSFPH